MPADAHARLLALVGSWTGTEELEPSPWAPGGRVTGRIDARPGADGRVLVSDHELRRDGDLVLAGVGVWTPDPDAEGGVLQWWFDTLAPPPTAPARGTWSGDGLALVRTSPRGANRTAYRLDGDVLLVDVAFTAAGAETAQPISHGRYERG